MEINKDNMVMTEEDGVYELIPVDAEVVESESNDRLGLGVIIGTAVTLGVTLGVKAVKKFVAKRKAKKEEANIAVEAECEDEE